MTDYRPGVLGGTAQLPSTLTGSTGYRTVTVGDYGSEVEDEAAGDARCNANGGVHERTGLWRVSAAFAAIHAPATLMPLTTPWGVDAFTTDNWDGLRPKDPINVVLTGPVGAVSEALEFLGSTVGWDWCLGGDQYVCHLRPVNAHRNDDQLASQVTTFVFVDRDHVRVYLTDASEPTGRVLVSPVHRDRWTGLRRWTKTRGGLPVPAWEVTDSFDEPRARIEEGAQRRGISTDWRWLGNRMAVRQANGRARASDGWVLVVGGP